jgi:hypothetical protein
VSRRVQKDAGGSILLEIYPNDVGMLTEAERALWTREKWYLSRGYEVPKELKAAIHSIGQVCQDLADGLDEG